MSNFHLLEVVGRGSETQFQVSEKFNLIISDSEIQHMSNEQGTRLKAHTFNH